MNTLNKYKKIFKLPVHLDDVNTVERAVNPIELFFDLIFVVALSKIAHHFKC